MDKVTQGQRSKNMAATYSNDTKPGLISESFCLQRGIGTV